MTDSNIQALLRRAEECGGRCDWAGAEAALQEALVRAPDNAEAHLQLSYIASLQGRYRDGRQHALQAAQSLSARDMAATAELLSRLRTFNEPEVMRGVMARLPALRDIPIPALIQYAAQLSYLNCQQESLALLDEARRGDPGFPPTLLARGQVLTYLGRFTEAEEELERCIARAPELAQAHWFLARLKKQSSRSNHVDRLERRLRMPARHREDPALLAYALHKELDDLGEHARAAAALAHACKAKRALLRYEPDASRQLVDALVAATAGSPGTATAEQADGRRPVFIVGMHRSGTTLLEQMLDGHGDVRGVGELYDFTSQMRYATDHHCRGVIDTEIVARSGQVDFADVGRRYLQGMEWRLGQERYFTDKLPSNFLNIGFICQALPQARILHMVRDPVETCFSNLRELFSDANPYSYDQLELAEFYAQYRRLMDHWHRAYPGRVLDVDYGELTRNPERVLREVCDFCGLDFEPGMLALQERKRGVATASAVQVREGIVARETPKWAPYAAYLQPLIQALTAKGFIAHA